MVLHTNANDASSLFSALRCVCAGVSFRLTIGFAQVPHYPFTMLAVPAYYHYPDNKQRCFRTKIKAVSERITYGSKKVRSIRTCLGTVRSYRAERQNITNQMKKSYFTLLQSFLPLIHEDKGTTHFSIFQIFGQLFFRLICNYLSFNDIK